MVLRRIAVISLLVVMALGGMALWSGVLRRPSTDAAARPTWNFLIVVVDTLRYDVTSMAGQSNTPFLRSLAERGASFSRAFSPHDSTTPSHFTLFTGLRDGLGSVRNDRPDMGLPFQLRAVGYDTFGVSANGNLSPKSMNTLGGFARFETLYDDWQALTAEQRAIKLPAINARLRRYGARELPWNQAQMYCSGQEVLTRLRRALATTTEPYFGFVNIIEPHDPYLPSPATLGTEPADAGAVDPDLRFRKLRFPLADPRLFPNREVRALIEQRIEAAAGRAWSLSNDLTKAELDTYKRRYVAAVRDADQIVRSIFEALEQTGSLDRTVVVVVSDHGESFGEEGFLTHSLSDKGDPEATMHVPMVWVPPPPFSGSRTIDEDVSLADVAPTIYELAGIDWARLKASASGEFGRSLAGHLAVARGRPTAQAELGADLTDGERERTRKEAFDRLRALGYIQ